MQGEPVNILLVDDQPAKLLSYQAILGNLGENLIAVGSAREALSVLLKNDIAVILVDVCMPELDGFQLVEMIREHPRYERIAVIFISEVLLTEPDRLRGYASGAVDYVPVPVVPEILRAKVRVFAELFRKTQQLEKLASELEERVQERTKELERTAQHLQDHRERLSQALLAANMTMWRRDLESNLESEADDLPPVQLPGVDAKLSVSAGDISAAAAAWAAAVRGKAGYEVEFQVLSKDGGKKWVRQQGRFVAGSQGQRDSVTGLTQDITEQKRAEAAQTLLIEELNHRVKNMLSTVQSIAMQSLHGTGSADKERFLSRLQALASCHNLLTRTRWEGARMHDIMGGLFAPHLRTDATPRITFGGPNVLLPSKEAVSVTLAFHELLTNAVKHGALANGRGEVNLTWELDAASPTERLLFNWKENGGPEIRPPERTGFGTKLLQSLAGQSNAAYSCSFAPSGFSCTLALPFEVAS